MFLNVKVTSWRRKKQLLEKLSLKKNLLEFFVYEIKMIGKLARKFCSTNNKQFGRAIKTDNNKMSGRKNNARDWR